MKIVLCTGGFDPLHSGHLNYFSEAKKHGDSLFVGVNSDNWLIRKKGQPFLPINERMAVVDALEVVDYAFEFDDSDNSAIDAIKKVRESFPDSEIIFANGGDRTSDNIPEMSFADKKLTFKFGVGGEDKKNSSSWILSRWNVPVVTREWGSWRVLWDCPGYKVKELTVNPGKSLSKQYHKMRDELWFVTSGMAKVDHSPTQKSIYFPMVIEGMLLQLNDTTRILKNTWHRLYNPFEEPCTIVEIQYGARCEEDDIVREIINP